MSKIKLFISYSTEDITKVALIERELGNHQRFEALVIARNKEPLKLLTQKVSEGLQNAGVIIPLLTENSISGQWVNQEVGYSFGIGKMITPIVSKAVLGKLKGFIHKEVDLSYSYDTNEEMELENTAFLECFRELLSGLEKDSTLAVDNTIEMQSAVSPTFIDAANEIKAKKEFQQRRKRFQSSPDAFEEANAEVVYIIEKINSQLGLLQSNGHKIFTEIGTKGQFPQQIELKSDIFSLSVQFVLENHSTFDWETIVKKNVNDVKLVVLLSNKKYFKKRDARMTDTFGENVSEYVYRYDLISNDKSGWRLEINDSFYDKDYIATHHFNEIVERINKVT